MVQRDDAAGDTPELVRRAQRGDTRAFGEIVARYQRRIFSLAVRLTGDRAAAMDLTQETFLRAYVALGRFEGRSSVGTWLYRIAVNLSVRHAERTRRLSFDDWPPAPKTAALGTEPALGPEELVLREEVKVGCLTGLVRCLPFEQRAAFVLATLLELPDGEVAEILECSPEAVRARLKRARDALSSFLDKRCQWVDGQNRCRCHRYLDYSKQRGLVTGDQLDPATLAVQELGRLRSLVDLYRGLAAPRRAEDLTDRIQRGIEAGEWRLLS